MSASKTIDGLRVPVIIDEEKLRLVKKMSLDEGDVVLCCYPKCGTHWMAFIVWSLQHPKEDPPDAAILLKGQVRMIETEGPADTSDPKTYITNLPPKIIPFKPSAKYIAVTRNPFDCCVSAFHFLKELNFLLNPTEDGSLPLDFFEEFVNGEFAYGDIFDHAKDWYARRNEPNVLLITYEELKKDLPTEIWKIARFLDLHKQLEDDLDGQLMKKILLQCSFGYMKGKFETKYDVDPNRKFPLMNKGQVGGYRMILNEDQIRRLREKMERELAGTDLLEQWKDL